MPELARKCTGIAPSEALADKIKVTIFYTNTKAKYQRSSQGQRRNGQTKRTKTVSLRKGRRHLTLFRFDGFASQRPSKKLVIRNIHIFQIGLPTSHKMEPKKRHNFLVGFFVPLHVVWSVLFRVLAPETTF